MLFSFLPFDESCLAILLSKQPFPLSYTLFSGNLVSDTNIVHHTKVAIVIKRKQPPPPVTCKPKGGLFVTKKNGHVEKALQFSRPISTLEVSYDNKEATCTLNADGSWLVILDGVTTDDITLSVIANGRLLPNVTLKVKAQGISKNDDPFGGMGL